MKEETMNAEKRLADWLGDIEESTQATDDPLLTELDTLYAGSPPEAAVERALAKLHAKLGEENPVLYYGELAGSPVGPISVALSEAGLVAVEFGEAGPEFLEHRQPSPRAQAVRSPERAGPVLRQLAEYFAGQRDSFNVSVDLSRSTDFQQQVLRGASIFVLPSVFAEDGKRDGIPVALMEAMAMELPVVSTRLVGIPELIEHMKEGLLVEQKNPVELSFAIETLLKDGNSRKEMGRQARLKVMREFNIHHVPQQFYPILY